MTADTKAAALADLMTQHAGAWMVPGWDGHKVAALLRTQAARIAELEAERAGLVAAERERLKAIAHNRAGYEAASAAHHAGKWQPAFDMHMARNAAMCDLINALFGPNVRAAAALDTEAKP